MLIEKDGNNTVIWQIDSRKKLLIGINRNSDGILTMMLDISII